MMDSYFAGTQSLLHILHLVDMRHEPGANDVQMQAWIQHNGVPCTVVGHQVRQALPRPAAEGRPRPVPDAGRAALGRAALLLRDARRARGAPRPRGPGPRRGGGGVIEILQGAARYVQGPGALSRMAQDLRGLESAFVVGGERGLAAFLPAFRLEGARIETGEPLAGKSTWEQARALAERAVRADAQAILGAGGGAAMGPGQGRRGAVGPQGCTSRPRPPQPAPRPRRSSPSTTGRAAGAAPTPCPGRWTASTRTRRCWPRPRRARSPRASPTAWPSSARRPRPASIPTTRPSPAGAAPWPRPCT